jgi:hypothetical protein
MDKPDFNEIADNDPSILSHDQYTGFVHGCEFVWRKFVAPSKPEQEESQEKLWAEVYEEAFKYTKRPGLMFWLYSNFTLTRKPKQ